MCECRKVSKELSGYISLVNHPSAGVSGSAVRGHALRGWWCGRTYSSFLFICSLHSGSGPVPQTCRVTNLTKTTIETISHRDPQKTRFWRGRGSWSTMFEAAGNVEGKHLLNDTPLTGTSPCVFFFLFVFFVILVLQFTLIYLFLFIKFIFQSNI